MLQNVSFHPGDLSMKVLCKDLILQVHSPSGLKPSYIVSRIGSPLVLLGNKKFGNCKKD